MEIVVIWSDSAIEELRNIYDFYYFKAGKSIADKLTNTIVDLSIALEHSPRMGQLEEQLAHLKKEIRYLVSGNYKIVYLINDNLITVATIFDCRMNPKKLKSKKV